MNNENQQFGFLDILAIASFILAIKNLQLNNEQVEGLQEHLKKQDGVLELEQNNMLKEIIQQNEEIIRLLKGRK